MQHDETNCALRRRQRRRTRGRHLLLTFPSSLSPPGGGATFILLFAAALLLLALCHVPTLVSSSSDPNVATLCLNDITATRETWLGIDFLYPPSSQIYDYVLIQPDSPHIHHVDLNCCGVPPPTSSTHPAPDGGDILPTLTPGATINVSLPTEPHRRRSNCGDHYEAVVWTYPQDESKLILPERTVIAVGDGTVCQYGFLQVHLREATETGSAGRACVAVPLEPRVAHDSSAVLTTGGGNDSAGEENSSVTSLIASNATALSTTEEESPSSEGVVASTETSYYYTQVVYFYASAFTIPSTADFWRVSTSRLYQRGKNTAASASSLPSFEVFAFKMHTHWRGVSMAIYRKRAIGSEEGGERSEEERTLIGQGDPSSTQNWLYTANPIVNNSAAASSPTNNDTSRVVVEEGDIVELECIYDVREINTDVRNCDSQNCEMCWVYLQVRTDELVSHRLKNGMVRVGGVASDAWHDPSIEKDAEEEELDEAAEKALEEELDEEEESED